jgi:vancomycin aglycone glucosyltransferase
MPDPGKPGRSLRVVLTSIGSRGDVQPILAIAQALAARGHHPVVAAPPDFAQWSRDLGFEFVPLGMDVRAFLEEHHAALGANPVRFFRISRAMFASELPAQMSTLSGCARDADAIVFAGGSVMAPSAGEKLGIPVLGVLFTTTILPSAQHAPVMVPWRTLPRWMNRALWVASDSIWNALLRRALNDARAEATLPRVRDAAAHLFAESRFVLAVDAAILPLEGEWSAQIPAVGFLFLDTATQSLDPELDAWLREGEPPVYAGFGSMTGRGPTRMRRVIVEAIEACGRRGLVGSGWAGLGDGALPRGWHVVGDAPHALLFPRVACVVHHGGAGTTASALRAGVPQVLVPLILDQYHHAQRLYEEQLAPRPVAMERITAGELAQAIDQSLALPAANRQRIAERLRGSNAARDIALRVEAMVRSRA